jgi:UDP-N-acetylglucosamine acyltransferase
VSVADIHPTAIVADGARIGEGVHIGAFSIVGAEVELEAGVSIREHVIIEGKTRIGAGTELHPFALVGGAPQDLSYRGEPTAVEIGPNCIIHEHATVHRGTARGRGVTRVGANCFLMISSHVAHDCVIGDNVILVNNVNLAGHVVIGDHAILSGNAGVQQHVRIGAHAFIAAYTGVATDVIPFASAIGYRAELAGLNIVGLKRRGFDRQTIHSLRAAYQAIFNGAGTLAERVEAVAENFKDVPAVMMIVDFIRAEDDRPLCTPRD